MQSTCQECGTALQLAETSVTFSGGGARTEEERNHGRMSFKGVCPNPDCPTNDSDLAKATGPDGAQ